MKNKKSQAVIIDLFIALFIFVLLLSITLIMWNKYANEINEKVIQKEMWIKAYQITDILVQSEGIPKTWHKNFSNINSLGLATMDRKLSLDKLNAFLNLTLLDGLNVSWSDTTDGYDLIKELLNIEGFEFYFRLFNIYGVNIAESGRDPTFYGNTVSGTTTIRRYVSLEECERCVLEISLWNEE